MYNKYEINSAIWLYLGMSGWHFITIPEDISKDIKLQFSYIKKGWGSIPVMVKLNNTKWKTSIFPDKKSDTYLLPIKADVRKKENLVANQIVNLILEVIR